ncbi:uncharacterized protein LOC132558816 [Ylistrum balloti]|uniref:uncharacterized protein LOC132558816 n=1 Tax=Ylistrum balloti TaxID=509963 RepID=UPI002905EC93|nr:uncharacterized protein LOC132558816 [Ylistrum balloti]
MQSIENSKEEEEDEEVFFGPVGFTERCVAHSVAPEVKPLSPLNAGQMAELVKEAALVAYRLKTDCKNSPFIDSDSPPKKRHSRSGTFTMENSPLKLLSLPIIESEESSVEIVNKPDSASKKNGNTVTKGNKENLLQQGRKLLTPKGSKSRRSGVVPPANKAKKSLQGKLQHGKAVMWGISRYSQSMLALLVDDEVVMMIFKTKPAEKPEEDKQTENEVQTVKSDVGLRTSQPVPVIKQALTSKVPDRKSGLARPAQRLQPPKSHMAVKAVDTSSIPSVTTTGSRPGTSLRRSLQPPKNLTKESDQSTNNSADTSSTKSTNNSSRRTIQPPKSFLAVKSDLSTNRSMNTGTSMNRRSLNTTSNIAGNRTITPGSDKDSKLKVPNNGGGTKLNRSYTISGPKSTQSSEVPGSKRPASKLSLLQPGQIKKKAIAMPSNTKASNGPIKAIAPPGIQSRTVERKPSVRTVSSSSNQDVSTSTPIKVQKNVQPKLLSSTFTATPSSSGSSTSFLSSTPASSSKRRSCLPTPDSSRTSSLSSIPPPRFKLMFFLQPD